MAKTPSTEAPLKSLRDKAMIVKFRDGVWSGQRRDREVTKHVAEKYEVKKKAGYYNKFLVARERLEKRVQIGLEARRYHNMNTLPWLDDGNRILPATNFQDYMSGMRKRQQEAEAAEQELYKDWDAIKKEGITMLGKMAKPADYPSLDELRSKFAFEIIPLPMPEVADWRIDVPQKELVVLRQQAMQALAEVQTNGLRELAERLLEVVVHCHERLKDEEATFRNSLFENIKKIVTLLPKLNITNDATLEALRKEVAEKLSTQTADEVRADPGLRKKVAGDAAAIMKKMSAYMGKR